MTSLNHDPKFACFITVRTASSRLPKNAFLKLKGPWWKSFQLGGRMRNRLRHAENRTLGLPWGRPFGLPGLSPRAAKGKTVTEHPIERVKCLGHAVQIAVHTTTLDEDDVVRDIAEGAAVACHRGPSAAEPARWPAAARHFGTDSFVVEDHDSSEKEHSRA